MKTYMLTDGALILMITKCDFKQLHTSNYFFKAINYFIFAIA